jgi:hypothetical protein
MPFVLAFCPLCQASRVRITAEQPNLVAFACENCQAQFVVSSDNVVRLERRRVPRDR